MTSKRESPRARETRSRRSRATNWPNAERAVDDLVPHTLDHFRYWAHLTTLDSGDAWELEPFQCEILEDVFEGYREVLAILPTGSYKTTTFGGFAVYHAHFTKTALVPIGAASRDQAAILYQQAAGFVRRSPFLQRRFKVQDGYKRISGLRETPYEGREIRVYSASDDTGDGIIPSLALIDELHRHKGHNLYGTWRDKLTKRDGQMVTLSTAGDTEENPLEQLRDAARKMPDVITVDGRHTVARSKGREFCMHEWALRREDDPHDLAVVKLANPAAQVTLEELRMRHDSPSTKLWQWLRLTCNVRAKGEESAIEPEEFDARRHDGLTIVGAVPTYLGLDLGWKIDHTAIVPVGWETSKRRLIAGAITLGPPVEEASIVAALMRLHATLDVRGVVYDPAAGGEQMVQQLEKGTHELQTSNDARLEAGLPPLSSAKQEPMVFVEHSQDNSPMSLAAVRFDEAFRYGWIRHDGANQCATKGCRCGGFRGHVTNAVARTLGGEKWKYDRPTDAKGAKRAKVPIDALTAAVMAHSVAVAEFGEGHAMRVEDYRIVTV
jgi:phage terminase large subunit-like protein